MRRRDVVLLFVICVLGLIPLFVYGQGIGLGRGRSGGGGSPQPPAYGALDLNAKSWKQIGDARLRSPLTFTFPSLPQTVNYLHHASLSTTLAGSLVIQFRVTQAPDARFVNWEHSEQGCGSYVTPFIFAYRNDMQGEFSRWWAGGYRTLLRSGDFSVTVPIDPSAWSSVYGKFGNDYPTEFANAMQNVSGLGVTFGGCSFYGHGVASEGAADFALLRYEVIR